MSAALTPTFTFRYEKRMKALREDEYRRTMEADFLYWPKFSKEMTIDGASERLTWFLNTADIRPDGFGGTQDFEGLVTQTTELAPQRYKSAINVKRDDLLDLRGAGLDVLSEWATQIGYKTAYFPQRLFSELLMNGANTDGSANAYDGQPFFSDNTTNSGNGHPYNPFRTSLGGYFNWLHGAASGAYPGACPIDDSVTVDVAVKNFQKALAYVRSWKMPDGITPRNLRPVGVIVPPRMTAQASQVFDAKYIAQAAASGGGSGDIAAIIRRWGLPAPTEAQELASSTSYSTQIMQAKTDGSGVIVPYKETITGNDTTYYIVMEQNLSSQLGGIVHIIREAFRVNFFSGDGSSVGSMTGLDAILNRALEIEYQLTGRMSMQYGHPYAIVRVDAA